MAAHEGIIDVAYNGKLLPIKGKWKYNLGFPVNKSIMGHNGKRQGITSTPQVAYIEGPITDDSELKLKEILTIRNATITLKKLNGKTIVFRKADYCGDGEVETEEGEVSVRFEANSGEEMKA